MHTHISDVTSTHLIVYVTGVEEEGGDAVRPRRHRDPHLAAIEDVLVNEGSDVLAQCMPVKCTAHLLQKHTLIYLTWAFSLVGGRKSTFNGNLQVRHPNTAG